jgi:hypothetical protein
LYTKYDTPAYPQNYNIYKRIAVDMFSMSGLNGPEAYSSWSQLRNILLSLVRKFHQFLFTFIKKIVMFMLKVEIKLEFNDALQFEVFYCIKYKVCILWILVPFVQDSFQM